MTKLSDTQRVILSRAAQHDALLATPPAKLPAAARQAVLRSMIGKGLLEEVPTPREAIGLGWRQDDDGAWIALRISQAGLAAIGVEAPSFPQDVDDNDTAGEPPPREPVPAPSTDLPTVPHGESLAAFPSAPPSPSGETPDGPQRPPVSQHGPIGHAAALRMAAATVLTVWDAQERDGLDEAISGLRDALAASPRAARAPRASRDPATPRQPRTGTKQETVLALLRRDEGTTIAEIIDATGWQPHTLRGFLAGLKRRGITVEVLERVRQVGPNKQGAKVSYSIYRIAEAG